MLRIALAFAFLTTTAQAQWTILDSHSTASFRGVDSVGKGTVWVSGTDGTVLRSEDAGYLWQRCTVPPGAEHLDFRGIQAFDANTAIVMSSGKGDLSRLYKTTDGCQTWKLIFTNPDKDGFWDAMAPYPGPMPNGKALQILGDPVDNRFPITNIATEYKKPDNFRQSVKAKQGEAAFAASNSVLLSLRGSFLFATGGTAGARVVREVIYAFTDSLGWTTYPSAEVPVGAHTESSGIFGLAANDLEHLKSSTLVAVGGDYTKPDETIRIAAWSKNGGSHWSSASTQPHGYRSAVAYDAATKTWITVGPNGTDVSTDDGRNWRALKPGMNDAPDADQHWNALSLPFVVGPHGRIGVLNAEAFKAK